MNNTETLTGPAFSIKQYAPIISDDTLLCAGLFSCPGALTSSSLRWLPGNLTVMTRLQEVSAPGRVISEL